jgi:hypothetical protein
MPKENESMNEDATVTGAAVTAKQKAVNKAPAKPFNAPSGVNKTDFIRKFPTLKPIQVEAKAREAGLDISASYVSSVRSKSMGKGRRKPSPQAPVARPAAVRDNAEVAAPSTPESKFEGTKTDFILKYPNLKPFQIEARAKQAGLEVTASYVSSIRSALRKKADSVSSPSFLARPATTLGGPKGLQASLARPAPTLNTAEVAFRRAARTITLERAQEILNEIAAAYGGE